jgi:hypothetical protein
VPDLANHYGGWQCAPCPDVLHAFGPDSRLPTGPQPTMDDDEKAERRRLRVQAWRALGRRKRAVELDRIST